VQTGCYWGTAELNNLSRSSNWCTSLRSALLTKAPFHTKVSVHPSALSHLGPQAWLLLTPLALAEQIAVEGELSHCTPRDLSTAVL